MAELTDKDFIQGNRVNKESLKCGITSVDTHQVLPYDENGKRILDDNPTIIRKDAFGRVYKKCNRCHKWKLLTAFELTTYRAKGGVKSICRECETRNRKFGKVATKRFKKKIKKEGEGFPLTNFSPKEKEDTTLEETPTGYWVPEGVEVDDKGNPIKYTGVKDNLEHLKITEEEMKEQEEEKALNEAIQREENLKTYSDKELADELKRRGYKGTLTISKDLIIG